MDTSLYGNAATELAAKAALTEYQEHAALIEILQRSGFRRSTGWQPLLLILGVVLFGAGEGLNLIAWKGHPFAEGVLYIAAGVGAVTGLMSLLLANRTRRELAAVINLLLREEARRDGRR